MRIKAFFILPTWSNYTMFTGQVTWRIKKVGKYSFQSEMAKYRTQKSM